MLVGHSYDSWLQEVKRLYFEMGIKGDYLKSLTDESDDEQADLDRDGLTPLQYFYWKAKQTPEEHVNAMVKSFSNSSCQWFH